MFEDKSGPPAKNIPPQLRTDFDELDAAAQRAYAAAFCPEFLEFFAEDADTAHLVEVLSQLPDTVEALAFNELRLFEMFGGAEPHPDAPQADQEAHIQNWINQVLALFEHLVKTYPTFFTSPHRGAIKMTPLLGRVFAAWHDDDFYEQYYD